MSNPRRMEKQLLQSTTARLADAKETLSKASEAMNVLLTEPGSTEVVKEWEGLFMLAESTLKNTSDSVQNVQRLLNMMIAKYE